MSLASLHPWIQEILNEFVHDGFQGYVIDCHSWLDPEETSPSQEELEQLSRPPEELEHARHEGLTLTFHGSKAYRMSDLEVRLEDPWVIKVENFYVIIGNATGEVYEGTVHAHTIVLYSIKYGRILGNALVLSRLGHFNPTAQLNSTNAKAGS